MSEVLLFGSLPDYLREEIAAGVTRGRCPRCGGGSTREHSLDVRQADTGILKLKCYRASCGWFGITITDPNAELQRKSIKEPTPFRDPIYPICGAIDVKLVLDYGCLHSAFTAHGWGMNERGDTLIMPVLDMYGETRGHVTRTFDEPKRCYTFKATAQPFIDWWPRPLGSYKPVVIVEDCISACRLNGLGYTAVALLGTNMSVDQAKEISNIGAHRYYLALDRDAFDKAIKLTAKHSHILRMFPICLDEDIKNMERDEDIHRLFRR